MDIFRHDRIPLHHEADVLVLGGGSAGCGAALAAWMSGARTVTLVERAGFPGGIATQVLDTFYGFFTPGDEPRTVALPDLSMPRLQDLLRVQGAVLEMPETVADTRSDGWARNRRTLP